MVHKKAKSKRLTTRMREKIRKKVSEHHRKQRREIRKDALINGGKKKVTKDLGIPNLYPYKKAILLKAMKENKNKKLAIKASSSEMQATFKGPDFDDLVHDAEIRSRSFTPQIYNQEKEYLTNEEAMSDISVKAYYKEFKNVVEAADVILEVLDCRDPLGCRPKNIERMILDSGHNKRIILVLNKIDLVPKAAVLKWLKYLRKEFPTLAFRSSTQKSRNSKTPYKCHNMSVESVPSKLMKNGSCIGADSLMSILKNYCRNKEIKTSIVVGVIGYPNVGKSSVINSLKRYKVCNVGPEAGMTKSMQQIHLDNNIKLIDSPGIVFRNLKSETRSDDLHLKNISKKKKNTDYIKEAMSIIGLCGSNTLSKIFDVVSFDTPLNFLILLAKKRGRILKKGVPNVKSAAEILINEWNSGLIPFYTLPPDLPEGDKNSSHNSSKIVDTWSKEFNMDEIIESEKNSIMDSDSVNKNIVIRSCNNYSDAMIISDDDIKTNEAQTLVKTTPNNNLHFNLDYSKEERSVNEELLQAPIKHEKIKTKSVHFSKELDGTSMDVDDYVFEDHFKP